MSYSWDMANIVTLNIVDVDLLGWNWVSIMNYFDTYCFGILLKIW